MGEARTNARVEDPAGPIRVWCLLRDQFAHVKPVEEAFGRDARFIYDGDWKADKLVAGRPDIVVCVNDFHYDIVKCLDAARSVGIPSLVLQDGILEWRCQYENPKFGAGGGAPQHQPVMADKIACIGRQSARQIAAWGNAQKVEVTGMPRLDHLLDRKAPPVRKPGSRILVMTAKTPGFTPEQRAVTLRSLQDVKTHLEALPAVQVLWRVSNDLLGSLNVENQLGQVSSTELVALLEQVDAVITTPSTAMLEAMHLERPVAALDYHNVPRFVPTAWTISATDQIPTVMSQLLNPPAAKMAFQQDCLADCLEGGGPSVPRVCGLLLKMVAIAGSQRQQGAQLSLPAALFPSTIAFTEQPRRSLASLYPDQTLFAERDLDALKVRLARAENENSRLKHENARLKAKLNLLAVAREVVKRLVKPLRKA